MLQELAIHTELNRVKLFEGPDSIWQELVVNEESRNNEDEPGNTERRSGAVSG
jgi:hypothetical protein